MIKVLRPQRGDRLSDTRFLKNHADAIEELQNQRPGPGLGRTREGHYYLLGVPSRETEGRKAASEVSGTPKVLGQTQGTQDNDTYDRDSDNVPVQFQVVTDIQYDESLTHVIAFRTRTVVATGIKSVSAESTLIEIATAVECPAT